MRKNLLLSFLISILFFSSCSKNPEDRLIGSWQVENAWRRELFGRDYFTSGYESSAFKFMENGDATYISSTDTLKGFWRSDRYNKSYYNSNGEWETRSMK